MHITRRLRRGLARLILAMAGKIYNSWADEEDEHSGSDSKPRLYLIRKKRTGQVWLEKRSSDRVTRHVLRSGGAGDSRTVLYIRRRRRGHAGMGIAAAQYSERGCRQ